jgi:hypothetical protein
MAAFTCTGAMPTMGGAATGGAGAGAAYTGAGATATGAGATGAGAGAAATGTTETGAAGRACLGKDTAGAPRQSFHESVARGGTGGFPEKERSKTPRFTSLPGPMRSREARTISSCVSSRVSAAASVVPVGTWKTYSR